MLFSTCSKEEEKAIKPIRYNGSYNRDFNDKHEVQLAVAAKIGIQPVANREEAEKMKRKLKEIKSGKNYEVDELTHSIPFLVPQATDLLTKIADNFADSLKNKNAPPYKIIVTSITRTQEDVKQLRRRNGNASPNSTHLYGTTFDISWKRFVKGDKNKKTLNEEQLKMVLASVLRDLKEEKACYVKHEKQQACFHITVRK
ncbi:hypothetical protein FACS189423_05750 [Bacteroidia bacterium]|nr:hypothetical protein FACS189423_05750 [Bacteroidia bacterium]